MNFNKMTKQQLKEYGESIGIKLDIRKKKDALIDELSKATEKEAAEVVSPVIQLQEAFDIKRYIWLVIFAILLVVNAKDTNFGYAAGVVTNMIVRDGLLFTLIAWVIMTKVMKREAWKWYDWLNALAYTTLVARVIYVVLIG
jgi:hypothetical protein